MSVIVSYVEISRNTELYIVHNADFSKNCLFIVDKFIRLLYYRNVDTTTVL